MGDSRMGARNKISTSMQVSRIYYVCIEYSLINFVFFHLKTSAQGQLDTIIPRPALWNFSGKRQHMIFHWDISQATNLDFKMKIFFRLHWLKLCCAMDKVRVSYFLLQISIFCTQLAPWASAWNAQCGPLIRTHPSRKHILFIVMV